MDGQVLGWAVTTVASSGDCTDKPVRVYYFQMLPPPKDLCFCVCTEYAFSPPLFLVSMLVVQHAVGAWNLYSSACMHA